MSENEITTALDLIDPDFEDEFEAPAPVVTSEITEPTYTADLSLVSEPYRHLSWAGSSRARAARFNAGETFFTPERAAAIAAFVDHGLVSQRIKSRDGVPYRVTFRITPAGAERLAAARAAADLVVLP